MKKLLVLVVSLVCCGGNSHNTFKFKHSPPDLVTNVKGVCKGKNKNYLAALNLEQAQESEERYVFLPDAGMEALKGYLNAEQCLRDLGQAREANQATESAVQLAKRLEHDYRKTWLRARHSLNVGAFRDGVRDLRRLEAFLKGSGQHPFKSELSQKIGKLINDGADNRTDSKG